MEKMDRRVRRSRMLLKNSLVSWLEEKPFQDITIKDVSERADLNRGTFYLHYEDTYDLLMDLEQDVLDGFQELFDSHTAARPVKDLTPLLTPVIHYVVENESICRTLFESSVSDSFLLKFKALLHLNAHKLVKDLYPTFPEASFERGFDFAISGFIGMLRSWLDQGMPQSIEEIAALSNNCLTAIVLTLLGPSNP